MPLRTDCITPKKYTEGKTDDYHTIDPSHGTGRSEYVPSMAMAALAAGTDALMIEVHPNPAKALSDGPQSLTPDKFDRLVQEMSVLGKVFDRCSTPAFDRVGENRIFFTPELSK